MAFRLIHTLLEYFGLFLFPEKCLGCKKANELFCGDCAYAYSSPERLRLGHDGIILNVFRYSAPPVRSAVRSIKYRRARRLAERLGVILADYAGDMQNLFSDEKPILVPIPLSQKTKRTRGYNHTEVLAQQIAGKHSWEIDAHALQKIKHTPSQTTFKNRRERKKNIKNSFALSPNFNAHGKTILLVDDVCTSGATLEEASRILKEAGAKKVFGIVVAKG